jgi:hypothetical protein
MNNNCYTPWWIIGLHAVFLCVWMLLIFKFFNDDPPLLTFFLGLMGLMVFIFLIRSIAGFFKQKAQFTIASIMVVMLGVGIFSKIYASFGYGYLLYFFTAAYIYINILWYWNNRIE